MSNDTLKTETILDELVAGKRLALEQQQQIEPLSALIARAVTAPPPCKLAPALKADEIRLIAEIKRASPTAGLLEQQFEPVRRADDYVRGGAAAISILTEERRFLGQLRDLTSVRNALAGIDHPLLLRKDFLFSPYQVYEARAAGADAILLIVAILDQALLTDLLHLTEALSLSALVEVHDEEEVGRALAAGAEIVGINNRDLRTFTTSLEVTERLCLELPQSCAVVSESGIRDRADVQRLAEAGVDAVLIGEALMRSGDVFGAVRDFSTVSKPARVSQRSQGGTG